MKKLIFIFAMLLTTLVVAQEQENKYNYYLAAGLSVSNTAEFQEDSYASVELGVMRDNLSLGVVFGRNNLVNIGQDESLDNYWLEGKVAVSFPLGAVDGYVLGGVGSYIGYRDMFLEYGVGISKEIGSLGYFLQLSNWDEVNYISAGFSIPLN